MSQDVITRYGHVV